MRTENEKAIARILRFLAALYPRYELNENTIAAYVSILSDLPAELIKAAAQDLGGRSTFFPAAAELRSAAFELLEMKAGLPTAYDAWGEVVQQMHAVGSWRQPTFSHELIERSVKAIGGWRMLCISDNPAADRARFVAAYETYVNRERTDMRMLPGVKTIMERLDGGPAADEIKRLADKLTGTK